VKSSCKPGHRRQHVARAVDRALRLLLVVSLFARWSSAQVADGSYQRPLFTWRDAALAGDTTARQKRRRLAATPVFATTEAAPHDIGHRPHDRRAGIGDHRHVDVRRWSCQPQRSPRGARIARYGSALRRRGIRERAQILVRSGASVRRYGESKPRRLAAASRSPSRRPISLVPIRTHGGGVRRSGSGEFRDESVVAAGNVLRYRAGPLRRRDRRRCLANVRESSLGERRHHGRGNRDLRGNEGGALSSYASNQPTRSMAVARLVVAFRSVPCFADGASRSRFATVKPFHRR